MNIYNNTFKDLSVYKNILFGTPRAIRTDEYVVQTPYFFSQVYNSFKLVSHQMSLSGLNMIVGYNAPVWDISLLAKPFTAGYLLLGNTYGLSWYWCSKIILMLLVSYEALFIITNKKKTMSVIGSLAFTFSPAIQWWFCPHFFYPFFWSLTLYVLGYYFFISKERWLRVLTMILLPICLTGFVIALYPAIQIGAGIIAIVLLVASILRDREKFEFHKIEIARLSFVILFFGFLMWDVFSQSLGAFVTLNSTAYPGDRVITGGGYGWRTLFFDLKNFFTPYIGIDSSIFNTNECELSSFFHITVFGLMIYPYLLRKLYLTHRRQFYITNCLAISIIVELIFLMCGFPAWLAKITLFSKINRMYLIYAYTGFLFSIGIINIIITNIKVLSKKIVLGIFVLFLILNYFSLTKYDLAYMSLKYTFVILLAMIIWFTLILIRKRKLAIIESVLMISMLGMFINPVVIGNSAITDHAISKQIQNRISDNKNWIAINSFSNQGFLLANGAKCINACNFYPDTKKWNSIDSSGKFNYYYNRYAHIIIKLSNKKSTIITSGVPADQVHVNLYVKDLKKWKIHHLLIDYDCSNLLSTNGYKISNKYFDKSSNLYIIDF